MLYLYPYINWNVLVLSTCVLCFSCTMITVAFPVNMISGDGVNNSPTIVFNKVKMLYFTSQVYIYDSTEVAPLVQHRYYLIQLQKNWKDAQTYCRTYHGDLATINSDADLHRLQAEANSYQFIADAWVGIYKELHEWRWVYEQLAVTSFSWASGEPSNSGNKEECAAVSGNNLWNDVPCTWVVTFWCYDGKWSHSGVSSVLIHIHFIIRKWLNSESSM